MSTINLGRVGFVNKGTYSGATAYKVNDVVVYNSGTYACIQANTGQAPTNTSYWQNWVADNAVHKTGDETIAGVKTFSSSPIVPTPTAPTQVANKAYADTKQTNLGFTPVQQGTGIGQSANAVKIGWSSESRLKVTVDVTDLGNIVMDNHIGVANSSLVKTALNASGSAPIYACRAWVNFNGTGTVAIRGSGNVSSITDNGTGCYAVNFSTAMPDTNYSKNVSANVNYSIRPTFIGVDTGYGGVESAPSTTSFSMYLEGSDASSFDAKYINVSVFK